MSNSTIDVETIDFTEGNDFVKALYNELCEQNLGRFLKATQIGWVCK